RRVAGLGASPGLIAGDRRRIAATLDGLEDRVAPALDRRRVQSPDLLESARAGRPALGQLDERGVGNDRADGTVQVRRCALAPGRQALRDGARARVELADARQALPGGFGVAL